MCSKIPSSSFPLLIRSLNKTLQILLKNWTIIIELIDAIFFLKFSIVSVFNLLITSISASFKTSEWLKSDEFMMIHMTFISRLKISFLIFALFWNFVENDDEMWFSTKKICCNSFLTIELSMIWHLEINWIVIYKSFAVSFSMFFCASS